MLYRENYEEKEIQKKSIFLIGWLSICLAFPIDAFCSNPPSSNIQQCCTEQTIRKRRLVCCQFALHSLSWHFVLITRPLIYNHVRKKRSKREAFSSLVCFEFPLLAFCSDHSCFQQITGQLRTNCAPTLVITEPIFIFFCSHQLIVCHFFLQKSINNQAIAIFITRQLCRTYLSHL